MTDDAGFVGGGPPPWIRPHRDSRKPVVLTAATVEEFIAWAAAVPSGEVATIQAQIAERCNADVVAALGKLLHQRPITDVAAHQLILSCLGESRHPEALKPLERFAWTTGDLFASADRAPVSISGHFVECNLSFNRSASFRARGIEMVAYLGTVKALHATLRAVREHPEADVRHAAIDAYLFAHDDSAGAIAEMTEHARPEDLEWVGVPRRTADGDGEAFHKRLAELHRELPPDQKSNWLPRRTEKDKADSAHRNEIPDQSGVSPVFSSGSQHV